MKKYALLGEKLSHSYSPLIHEYLFQKYHVEASYELWELEAKDISKALSLAKEKNLSGFNITVPYKESLLSSVDEVDSSVEKIGASNTILLGEKSIAYNTDYFGFRDLLSYFQVEVRGKKVVILGTGGSAKAVSAVLQDLGAQEISFISRNQRAKNIFSYDNIPEGDILINCTPIGMYPKTQKSPISGGKITNFKIAIDLIYNPKNTKFLEEAKSFGLIAINGLFMLVAQAIKAQEIWLKKTFDKQLYHEVYMYVGGKIYEDYGD